MSLTLKYIETVGMAESLREQALWMFNRSWWGGLERLLWLPKHKPIIKGTGLELPVLKTDTIVFHLIMALADTCNTKRFVTILQPSKTNQKEMRLSNSIFFYYQCTAEKKIPWWLGDQGLLWVILVVFDNSLVKISYGIFEQVKKGKLHEIVIMVRQACTLCWLSFIFW